MNVSPECYASIDELNLCSMEVFELSSERLQIPLHSEKYIGSTNDIGFLRCAFAGVDTAVHIAGISRSKEIIQGAADCHVQRLIAVHTKEIYSKHKQAGEEYRQIDEFVYKTCSDSSIALTVLRPTMIYGNSSDNNVINFVKMVDKLPLMPVVNGARYEL